MTTTPLHAENPPEYPIPRKCPYRPASELVDLRKHSPMTKVRLYNGRTAWLVTDTEAARTVLADHRKVSISAKVGNFPMLNEEFEAIVDSGFAEVLFGADPPVHTQQRQMIMPSFTMRRVDRLHSDIQRIVEEKFDEMMSQGNTGDIVAQFAHPVPSLVISLLLGVPAEEREEFDEPARRLFSAEPGQAEQAMTDLNAYLEKLISHKEANPGAGPVGLVDDLVENQLKGGKVDRATLIQLALAMLVAGTDTTTNVISLGTLALLDNREQWDALVADPGLVPNAVAEMLRYVSLIEQYGRVATEDIDLGGHVIKAGEGILISSVGVAFDPATTPDPFRFDITREPGANIAFGHGVHRCPGAELARLELEITFRAMIARMPNLRITIPHDQVPGNNDGTLQRLFELPVAW
ncbi:cytochrome P450 [Amycolatopsis sp. TRM77291]